MGLLEGKRLLVTGVITDASIAFAVAKAAQEQGATVVLTGFGRLSLVNRVAGRLPSPAPVIELDVSDEQHLATQLRRLADAGATHFIANTNGVTTPAERRRTLAALGAFSARTQ